MEITPLRLPEVGEIWNDSMIGEDYLVISIREFDCTIMWLWDNAYGICKYNSDVFFDDRFVRKISSLERELL